MHRRALLAAAALPLLHTAPGAAQPAWRPNRTVTIIVPFPPGGGTDVLARLLAAGFTTAWGQTVVVENRPGAAGRLGAEVVQRAAPDGHTLLMASTGTLLAVTGLENPPPVERVLSPVTLVVAPAYIVAVSVESGIGSVAELVARAKAAPGTLAFGSSGVGAASHLAGELFAATTGVELLHVPYRGTGPALNDLIGGRIQLMFSPPQTVEPAIAGGRVKAIGITSPRRSPLFESLPTVAETVPGYSALGWFGLLGPRGMPAEVAGAIQQAATAVLDAPEGRRRLAELGATPEPLRPDAFARYIDHDLAGWRQLIRTRHIPME